MIREIIRVGLIYYKHESREETEQASANYSESNGHLNRRIKNIVWLAQRWEKAYRKHGTCKVKADKNESFQKKKYSPR